MKRTLSFILALVLALSCVFTLAACSNKCDEHVDANYDEICDVCEEKVPYTPEYLGFEGLYNTDYEEDEKISYSAAALLDTLNDMIQTSVNGTLRIFEKNGAKAGEKKLAVLNTETGAVVFTLTKEEDDAKVTSDAELYSTGKEVFIRVTTTDKTDKAHTSYTYKLYTALGAEITSKTAKQQYMNISIRYIRDDLYEIEDKIYEIKDSVATLKYEIGLGTVPYYDATTEKYNYAFSSYEALVYDKENKLVASYTVPVGSNAGFFVLANGNIFIQYGKVLPFDATEFDYYSTNNTSSMTNKYDITQLIFDVETKTEKALELDYIVMDIINAIVYEEEFTEIFAKDKMTNVVEYVNIVDKMVNTNDVVYANMTNDMFTIGYLADEVAGQRGIAELIADNRFIVSNDVTEQEFLLNEKGEVIGDVTGGDFDEVPGYIVKGSTLYDLDLKPVFNMGDIAYEVVDSADNYIIFRDTAYDAEDNATYTYYICNLLNGAAMTKLELPKDAEDFNCYTNYFTYTYEETVDSVTKEYKVYCNTNGLKITSVELKALTNYSIVYSGDTFVLLVTSIDENLVTSYRYYVAK